MVCQDMIESQKNSGSKSGSGSAVGHFCNKDAYVPRIALERMEGSQIRGRWRILGN